MTGLTQEQIKQFNEQGMLCISDFLSHAEVKQMMASAHDLLTDLDMNTHPRTQFKTGDNNHIGDKYFFESSDKVSYFFDVDAFDENGLLQYPKEQAVNKIGHGLHMHHDLFREITFKERVKDIARDLQYTDPRVLQSMLIFKNAIGKGVDEARKNDVPPHTDGTFLYTNPQSALGFWFALEDCTAANGCLSYHPGSHKSFPIQKRFVRVDGASKGCKMLELKTHVPCPQDSPEKYKLFECKAGSLILIHNSVLHKSERNVLGKSRFAYAFHLIDGVCEYDSSNWLQVPPLGGANFLRLYEG
ncbi:phytanoyl-CoA dioxygenase [Metschnikowia bicuspidata var. bicuspidata NRRL YB-4993]|uniref:Phytanoyl-CoA dioxygenase n=1 Tax=Metschnikowia bicuspidata var. bicuspidata NRRL YB-4993 TaxID=869754 RepID=A0A1A0HFR9_9ASCO|nr:phytanoyl-CoA dioxygenase [Metschnikowia bicuspidata var. bicuspidata NRRL YB-4993]OBA23004.1 phytanoyl-CoA dioxygenase [Metschnikowia bicuspidata var. bicuspidata NRRL YB-4993]